MKKLDIEIENKIIELYLNKNILSIDIAVKLGINRATIYKILKRNNISTFKNGNDRCRKFYRDDNFFEKIDSSCKSYFLGLMFADGNVYLKTNRIGISLKATDRYILDRFKEYIKYDGNLCYVKKYDQFCLAIKSNKLCLDLINKGCVENKSLILSSPVGVENKYIKDFIRGYIDGDGSLGIYNRKYYDLFSITICGTFNFCNFLKDSIYNALKINSNINKTGNIYRLSMYKKEDVLIFLDWIYSDTDLYLTRKYNIYLQMKNKFNNG